MSWLISRLSLPTRAALVGDALRRRLLSHCRYVRSQETGGDMRARLRTALAAGTVSFVVIGAAAAVPMRLGSIPGLDMGQNHSHTVALKTSEQSLVDGDDMQGQML